LTNLNTSPSEILYELIKGDQFLYGLSC